MYLRALAYLDVNEVRRVSSVVPDLQYLSVALLLEVHVIPQRLGVEHYRDRASVAAGPKVGIGSSTHIVLAHANESVEHVHHKPKALKWKMQKKK